tara:strand:- start:664 stop:1821 length:1158 start_codon:yes stop_codon:yes gene_type:complete
MSKADSILNYLEQLASFNASLPDGSEGVNQPAVKTPPHSGTQRTSSSEKLNGVKVIKAQNEEGRVTYIVCTDNGQSINMDETGNIFIGCGKIGDDEGGGQLTARPQGAMTVKVGDTLSIEVENKLDEEKPLSVKVFGDINMEAVGGDLHLAGNNVNINAKTDLYLKGSKVSLQGGDGAGGAVEIVANTFKTDTVFINNKVTGGVTQNVFGEYTIRQLLDPRASFNIISSGAMNITSGGDFSLNGAGRAEVLIAGLPPKPIPTAKSPAAFTLTVGTGNALMSLGAGNLNQSVTGALTQAVTGAITSTFDGNIVSTFKGNVTRDYKGTMVDNIDGNVTKTYKGTYTQSVTGNHLVTSKGQYNHNVTGTFNMISQGVVTITGTQIYLN